MTTAVTHTKGSKTKNKESDLKESVANSNSLDEVLQKVIDVDTLCCFAKCKKRTRDFAIQCKYCNKRFCTTHGLPEIHGCGEAVKRDEKRKFLHPETKLSHEKHSQAQTKLSIKLKQMQLERKPKQNMTKPKK